ncbi:SelT/SelW/SelH family protein [Martelella alba]|uniref:SelT/SelW/SelH family protein n=1 Tax=Martelella alba TaxID=2590451 RepID=A0A506U9E9_9HYPH|nr:SelT/SelW/SelH family protein [Martelella alba]TPW31003.1 SelT/SelW/SelH family protein [Martelella alba]
MTGKPSVRFVYCSMCNWLMRSAWMAQELLSTFSQELHAVTLEPRSGGIFEIYVDEKLVWERKRDGGFPSPKQLKQLVRDVVDPDRDLGHVDRSDPA